MAHYALLLAKLDVYYSFLPDAYNYPGNATPAPITLGRISRFLNENFCQQTTVCTALSYINYTRTCCTSERTSAFSLSLSLSLSLFSGSRRANRENGGTVKIIFTLRLNCNLSRQAVKLTQIILSFKIITAKRQV